MCLAGQLGTVVMVFGVIQPLNAVFRPAPGPSITRRMWEFMHWFIGQLALLLGAINVFLGIQVLYEVQGIDRTTYIGLFAGLLCIVVLIKDSVTRRGVENLKQTAQQQSYELGPTFKGNFAPQPISTNLSRKVGHSQAEYDC